MNILCEIIIKVQKIYVHMLFTNILRTCYFSISVKIIINHLPITFQNCKKLRLILRIIDIKNDFIKIVNIG